MKNLKIKFYKGKPFWFGFTIFRDKPNNIFLVVHFAVGVDYRHDIMTRLMVEQGIRPKRYFIGLDFLRHTNEGEEIRYVATFNP